MTSGNGNNNKEVEPVQPDLIKINQSNTYREDRLATLQQ